jgi:CDP-glucose 4,6-dehydratase
VAMLLGRFGMIKEDLSFYKNKIVLVTGHTGFKGSWLCKILINFGAKVVGYSLLPPTTPNLFDLSGIEKQIVSIYGDIRDYEHLKMIFEKYKPEIVFHLAAQPIVRESYVNPRYTYETNVIGTVNVCECVRLTPSVKSFLNVTTDKVYLNDEIPNHAFSEDEPLDGYNPMLLN